MKKTVILLSCIVISGYVFATGDLYLSGGRAAGMSQSSVTLTDVWSVFHNQAALSRIGEIGFGVHYSNEYFMQQLSMKSMALVVPVRVGALGVCLSHFGYSKYSETRAGISYGMALGDRIAMGIQLNYLNVSIDDYYGNSGAVFGEVGILAEPVDHFFVGIHIFNPWKAKIADYNDERIPAVVHFGLGYEFSDKAVVTAEAVKDFDFKMLVKAGAEYNVVNNLFVRAGVSSDPERRYSFGIGYQLKGFQADFSFSHHYILGFTPHFSLTYRFLKKKTTESDAEV